MTNAPQKRLSPDDAYRCAQDARFAEYDKLISVLRSRIPKATPRFIQAWALFPRLKHLIRFLRR